MASKLFCPKPDEEIMSMDDITSNNINPIEVGPPMTLLSNGHRSRKPRRTCSSPIRFMPKIKKFTLEKTPLPDCQAPMRALKEPSILLRPEILRPHSSPVRSNALRQIYRDNDYDSIISSDIKSPPESPNYSFHAYGAGEAYFSSKPPIAPVRLVVSGPAIHNKRVQRYLQAMHQIEMAQKAEDRLRFARSSSGDPALSISRCSTPVRKQRGKNKKVIRFVKSMVTDLVQNLPLVHDAPVQVSNMKSAPNMQDMRTSPTRNSARSNFGQFSNEYSRCSIAVQALVQQNSPTNTAISTANRLSCDDWIGGVRALRDSHVRLVLRQLRHITCLNRALDRATKDVL